MIEALAGSIICSAASPCPDGLPFTAFIGLGPDTANRRKAERRHTVVLERARSGDLQELLMPGAAPERPKLAWAAFVNGVSLIPGGVPELASVRDLDAVLALLQQLAIGLQHLKERCVLHRDIKPANVMLDGASAKFIDFGTVCALDGINAKMLPSKLGKFKEKCPTSEMQKSDSVNEGRAYKAMGCPLMEMGGSLPYISPLRHMGARLNFGEPALDALTKAMAGNAELAAQFKAVDDNTLLNMHSQTRANDLPYSVNWELARTYDIFSLGIMATELLTGQYGGIHSVFRYTCDGTIAGNQMCPLDENRAFCADADGETNIRLAKWLALDNMQAPPSTDAEKARARNRLWTLLKTVAEAARCGAPAPAPAPQAALENAAGNGAAAAAAPALAWNDFCKDKANNGINLRSASYSDKRAIFNGPPLKGLAPGLQYKAMPALYMPPAFSYTKENGEAVTMDGKVNARSPSVALGWPSALLPMPATEATIKNVPIAALGDEHVEQVPAESPVLVELLDLLRSMLAFHSGSMPEPADVIVELDDIRRKLYAQVAQSPAAQQAQAPAIGEQYEKHASCLRACQAMASETAGRLEEKKARNAEQACNRHAGSLGRAAGAYCRAMWTYFDTTQLDVANLKDLLKHSDSSLEITSAAIDAICRRSACPLATIDTVQTTPVAAVQPAQPAQADANGVWASIAAVKGPVAGGGLFGATSFAKWSKDRTITVKERPAAAGAAGRPRLEVRWKAGNGGALDFDFTDKETAAGGCEQVKEAKWFAQDSFRDGCAGRERAGGMCVCASRLRPVTPAAQ